MNRPDGRTADQKLEDHERGCYTCERGWDPRNGICPEGERLVKAMIEEETA